MTNEKISVDDLLTGQSKQTISATVEGIEGQPNLVKITPWTAAAGCLCHLSVKVAKSSLEGVTPTGDTHVCCGKTLKVVELHFKKGESIAFEELFGQLHALANGATSISDPVHENPAEAPNQPPLPIPPPWGWGYPPWADPFKRQAPHPWKWTALDRGRSPLCEVNHSRCLDRCQYSLNPQQCRCLCDSSYSMCVGHPGFECPD
jgi:hypothetical protein